VRVSTALIAIILASAALLPACGGGGSDSASTVPGLPGVLLALAVQGDAMPGGGGNFGGFPAQPRMDTADDGFSVFVAPTTHATKSSVLYASIPAGGIVEVFAVGDGVPDAGDETILGFGRVWVRPGGKVVAYVILNPNTGGRTFGVLSAVVSIVGGVTQVNDVVYDGDALPPATGTLFALNSDNAKVDESGAFFFMADMDDGDTDLFSIECDGSGVIRTTGKSDSLPGAQTLDTLTTFGIDSLGTQVAFVAAVVGGLERVYVTAPGQVPLDDILVAGTGIPNSADTVADVYSSGPLVVYASGAVVWSATGSASVNDDLIFIGNNTAIQLLVRNGLAIAGTPGSFGPMDLLDMSPDTAVLQFSADVVGAPPVAFSTFVIRNISVPPAPSISNVRGAPSAFPLGTTYTAVFPGLNSRLYHQVSRDASFAFGNVLSNAISGLFWAFSTAGPFAVAADGSPAPNGDLFAPFITAFGYSVANGILVFRAGLDSGLTGIFRQR